jgi:YVTN family beta-propeller protein
LIADNQSATLTIMHGDDAPTALPAATGVSAIYTAWFDSLALVPSSTSNAVLLYDLDTRRPAGIISLASAPGKGAVTPDGRKLYLPLPHAGQVAVIDARQRKLIASIPISVSPATVLLAGSYGVCH